jgi:hypothetical protein
MAEEPKSAPPPPDPASKVACNHLGCDAQPGEPCIDRNFAGGEVTITAFVIDAKPAFHAERIAMAADIAAIEDHQQAPSAEDFEEAAEDSGLF